MAQNAAREVGVRTNGWHTRRAGVGVDIPTKAEVRALLDSAPPRWRPLIVTATFTGLRASELRGLRWEDVDLDKRLIRVRQRADQWGRIGAPKSAAGRRDVPMSPMVANALKERKLASRGGGLVFGTRAGKPESHANISSRCFYPLQVRCGVVDGGGRPKFGLHALRHFFAS